MEKKIGKLVVVIISVIGMSLTQAQADTITVPNFSFELDENSNQIPVGDFSYINDSLAWNEAVSTNDRPFIRCEDSPVSPYIPDGDSYLMIKKETGDQHPYNELSLTWQILAGEPVSEGDTYLLTFNAIQHDRWGGNVLATLVYDDGTTLGGATIYGEAFVPVANADLDNGEGNPPGEPWDEFMVHFTAPAGAPYIGKDIGIKFEQDVRGWVHIDNVRLELNPDMNFEPEVDAGLYQSIRSSESAQLAATVIDDGNPDPPGDVSYTWTGPAGVSFLPNPNVEDPCAVFTEAGIYELQLCASDSEKEICDVVTIRVRASSDLVAHWDFETGNGTNVVDRTANNNFGTFAGDPDPNWVSGWIDNWALDVADNSYVEITTDPIPDPNLDTMANEVTVAAWVKIDSWASDMWTGIVTKGDGGAGGLGGWSLIRNSSSDSLSFYTPDAGYVGGSMSVRDGHWHHIAGVHNGATISLNVDGVLDASADASGFVKPNTARVWINGNSEYPGERFFNGEIDDVRIYNYGLNANEIAALAAMGNTPPVVYAGADKTSYMQNGYLKLDATVTDDGIPVPATLVWTQTSETGTATFDPCNIEDPCVTFSEVGTYVLRLTADDTVTAVSDEVTITVENPTCQDVINAGLLLPADLSGPEGSPDCRINLYDFAAFANDWLCCNDPQDPDCEFPFN